MKDIALNLGHVVYTGCGLSNFRFFVFALEYQILNQFLKN